jgi:pimeloyl-ACP methyl ester carboxylesterase
MRNPLKSQSRKSRLALTGAAVAALIAIPGGIAAAATTSPAPAAAAVYVDAYIPAQGDTINSINAQFPGSQLTPDALSFVPSPGGVTDVYVKPAAFRGIFANDLPAGAAAVLAATQEPIAASALTDVSGKPAWATVPSWDVIGTADHAITPAAQEFMAARAHAKVTKVAAGTTSSTRSRPAFPPFRRAPARGC